MGDENTRAFLGKLKKGQFVPDESMVDVCGFDPDLEGFEVISLALAPPLPKAAPIEEEEEDEEKELEQAKQLVLEKVTQAFAQKHGRDPTQQERAAIAAAAEAKLQGFTTGSQTGKERRAANREAREKASAAFEKADVLSLAGMGFGEEQPRRARCGGKVLQGPEGLALPYSKDIPFPTGPLGDFSG